MDTLVLEAASREKNVRADSLRRLKRIPAIVYGSGIDPVMVSLAYQTFRHAYIQAGETGIIDLDVDSGKKKLKVLVHDLQHDPVSHEISHIDFLNVRMDQKITTSIPVEVTGVAPAVKDLAGVLTVSTPSIRVRCLPGDLVKSFVIDVSVLKTFHDSIHVRDLKVPPSIQLLESNELTVATVLPPRKEEEVAAPAAAGTEAAAGGAAPAAAGTEAAACGAAPAAAGTAASPAASGKAGGKK